jgi:hypothetical protein
LYYYVPYFEAENEGPSTNIMIQIVGGKWKEHLTSANCKLPLCYQYSCDWSSGNLSKHLRKTLTSV